MYRLIRFGTISLEHANQVENIGSGATPVNYQALPEGGALDNFGDVQTAPGVVERGKSLRLTAASEAALSDLFFTLLGLRGRRDQLYRRTARGEIHWMYARLVEVAAERNYEQAQFRLLQDIALRFACQEAAWRGSYRGTWYLDAGINLDSGYYLDSAITDGLASSPTAITITIGTASDPGRAVVRAVRIVVSAGNAEMSAVTIARTGGESLTYDGAIAAGGQLTIDAGTMQVSCTGVTNAYANLEFPTAADRAAWFLLQPGANPITVTFTGGGSGRQIAFEFYETWN
jgi:hypothetical protein